MNNKQSTINRVKRLLIAFCLLLIAAPTSALAGTPYGVGAYLSTRATSASDRSNSLSKLAGLSATWTRQDINYNNWSSCGSGTADSVALSASRDQGLNVIGMLNYSSLPSVDAWGDFVSSVAECYDGDGGAMGSYAVQVLEIMNEPNSSFTPSAYLPYLIRSYEKVKAASSIEVMSGSTAQVDVQFLEVLWDLGGWNYFDAVGIHPYRGSSTASPEEVRTTEDTFPDHVRQAEALIGRHGGTKKLYITEFGWQTSSSGVSQASQSDFLTRAFVLAKTLLRTNAIVSYNLRDDFNFATEVNANYGVTTYPSFTNKSAYSQLSQLFSRLDNKNYVGHIERLGDSRIIDDFEGGTGDWSVQSVGTTVNTSNGPSLRGGKEFFFTYQFQNSGNNYTLFRKSIGLGGVPTSLGVWINGDDSRNVWRMRIVDASGETFQIHLSSSAAKGFRYLYADLTNSTVWSHWGGNNNGSIEYPIRFDSLVFDDSPDISTNAGYAAFDDLTVTYGPWDYFAHRFADDVIVAWKSSSAGAVGIPVEPNVTGATVYDKDGASTEVTKEGTVLNVALTTSPKYIVQKRISHQFVSQNFNQKTVHRGECMELSLTVKNSGATTWERGLVNLGTDRPQDRIPGFIREGGSCGSPSGWLNHDRVELQQSSVAPGANGTFKFYYTVPSDKAFGTYREYFRMVADFITWMEDYGIYWEITVAP
jgi:hypothetical protein